MPSTQSKPANVRYKNLLILLNRYGRTSGSVNVVAQIIADIFTLDLAVAQLLLTEVVSRSGHPGEFVINALLEPLFIDSGKEKLAAAIAAEFLQDAFSIIEGTSTMTDADIEAFIVLHFDFLDSEEAKSNLLGSDALSDVVERYQYVTAPLDEAQYALSEEVFAEQFAAVWSIQKSALVVNKFQITETELPVLSEHAAALQVLPIKGYPFVEQEHNFAGFKAWQNLANLRFATPSVRCHRQPTVRPTRESSKSKFNRYCQRQCRSRCAHRRAEYGRKRIGPCWYGSMSLPMRPDGLFRK